MSEFLQPCPRCQLKHQCLCDVLPELDVPTHIALLMHENELSRETNTGQWLLKSVRSSSSHVWQRKTPCPELLALLESELYQPFLLFPSEESQPVEAAYRDAQNSNKTPLFIILDGTWQEAKKMLRKSDWLSGIPHAHISPTEASRYQLRRNQQAGHLCTLEVGCEVLIAIGEQQKAQQLLGFFEKYMQAFKADKSGHALKG